MKTVFVILNKMLKAESCIVLIVQFDIMMIGFVIKIHVHKNVYVLAHYFPWGNKGGVHTPAEILVDFCDLQGARAAQLFWRVPVIDMGSNT